MAKDELKDVIVPEEDAVETLEYTDDEGLEHCFVIESKFKVGEDQYAALIEVDPALFEEGEEGWHEHHHEHGEGCCGHHHEHGEEGRHEHHHEHGEGCCGHHHGHEPEHGHDEEEEVNIILAKITEDENGEIDIQVPTDEEFEKAVAAYEALNEEE